MVNNYEAYASFKIIFANISLIENLIDCNSIVSYIRLVIRNVAFKTIIDLDADVFVIKKVASLILGVVEINEDNINRKMAFI